MDPKLNKIAIIGAHDSGLPLGFNKPVHLKDHHKPEVIIIDDKPEKPSYNVVEINGVKWKKDNPEPRHTSSSKMGSILAMTIALSGGIHMPGLGSGGQRKRPVVDLVKEYGLVQLKQSKLSRSEREWVVYTFESNYTKL